MAHDPDKMRGVRAAGLYLMIPAILLASPVVGFVLGKLLSEWLGTGPWLVAVMALLGMAAGGREVVRIIRRAGQDD